MKFAAESALGDPECVLDLPPELVGGLTFHLPLVLQALEVLGTEHPAKAVGDVELAAAFEKGLVDPPFYRWAVEAYATIADRMINGRPHERLAAFSEVEELGEGLAGAAFHGLIRLGYAAARRDSREAARGLAYMRSRRQVLRSGHVRPPRKRERSVPAPSARTLEGATIFEQFNLVAGEPIAETASAAVSPRGVVEGALVLFHRNPSSFVAVHALTSAHALIELSKLVEDAPVDHPITALRTATWWESLRVAHAVASRVIDLQGDGVSDAGSATSSLRHLITKCVETEEVHTIKVAASMSRLLHFGVVDDASARRVLLAKLACDDC
jgi:hypothetical protein